jgi:hypothetical protein
MTGIHEVHDEVGRGINSGNAVCCLIQELMPHSLPINTKDLDKRIIKLLFSCVS